MENAEVCAVLDAPYQDMNDPTREPYFSLGEIPGVGVLRVFSPEDVLRVHRDSELLDPEERWVSREAVPWFMRREAMGFLFNSPAAHHPGERLDMLLDAIDDALNPAAVARLQPAIIEEAARLFHDVDGPYNLNDKAEALSSWAIRKHIGALSFMASPEEQAEFYSWMNTFNAKRPLTLFSHVKKLRERCDAFIAERQLRELGNDPLDEWIRREQNEELEPGDASLLMQVILHAATGTTNQVIDNTVATLLTELSPEDFADFMDQLGSDRTVRNGIAESARKRPPAQERPFGVHKKTEFAGRTVRPKIHMISASMASVNRDPDIVGEDPDKLILGRPNKSITFGSHQPKDKKHGRSRRCPGEHTSYLIAVPAVREALSRHPKIRSVKALPGAVVQIPELILA